MPTPASYCRSLCHLPVSLSLQSLPFAAPIAALCSAPPAPPTAIILSFLLGLATVSRARPSSQLAAAKKKSGKGTRHLPFKVEFQIEVEGQPRPVVKFISHLKEDEFDRNQGVDGNPYKLYESLSISYPSLLQPLVHERDTYLAWSLKRSKAVNKSKKVLGVIGKGHMNGVVFALISDQGDLRFRDLAGEKSGRAYKNRWQADLLRSLLRDTILGFMLWLLYEQLKTTL